MSCNKCKIIIKKSEVSVKCCECFMEFHLSCCPPPSVENFKKLSKKRNGLDLWKCDLCETSGDNASVSSRSDNDQDPAGVMEVLKSIQKQLKTNQDETRSSFINIRDDIKKMDDSIKIIHTRVGDVESRVVVLSERVSELESVNVDLLKRVSDLEVKTRGLEQYSRRWNLEIRGIPYTLGEDVYEVLRSVSRALGVTYDRSLISIAHRLRPDPRMRFPPVLIVQFISRSVKGEWMLAARQKRLQASDINPRFESGPVFICDQLTPHDRRLLNLAKQYVREGRLHGGWVSDGKIMVRQHPDSPPRRVWLAADIHNLVPSVNTVVDVAQRGN